MSITRIRGSKSELFRSDARRRIAWLNLGILSLFLAAPTLDRFLGAAQACSNPGGTLKTVLVTIDGIDTVATTDGCTLFGVPLPIEPGLFCAIAISHGNNVILDVSEVQAFESGVPSRFTFAKDSSGQIARGFFQGTTNNPVFAEGFFSSIPQNGVPPADVGRPITFRLKIRLKRNATFDEIKSDLAKPNGMIGLGKAKQESGGNFSVLDNEHKKITDLGDIAAAPTPFGAPTLSEWGMIVMTLMLLSAGTLFIGRRPSVAASAAAEGGTQFVEGLKQPLFVPKLFGELLAGMLPLMVIVFAIVTWLSGRINPLDIGGTLLCTLIFAYLVHLLILIAKDSHTGSE